MIRLKDILLEYEDSHESTMNVLFAVDDRKLRKFGFIRQLISQGVILGDVDVAHEQSSEELKDLVIANASPEYDLIVVVSRGIYDDDPVDVIRNFGILQQYADSIDVPVAYFTIPTLRFIKDTTSISDNWTEIERLKLNNYLRQMSNSDYLIDLSGYDHNEYYSKDGTHFNLQGHYAMYKLLFNIIQEVDPKSSVKTDIGPSKFNLGDVQRKLQELGYEINQLEIMKSHYGETTRRAVDNIRKQLGYPPNENLTKSLAKAILLLTIDQEHNIEIEREFELKCPNPKYPRARFNYTPADYTGRNGIAGNWNLTNIYGVILNAQAAEQYKLMIDAMPSNIKPSQTPGGFRSYQTQYNIINWDHYECHGIWRTKHLVDGAPAKAAEPGKSNHGKGAAIDVSGTATQDWIRSNGEAYGWSWDEGKAAGERWHFRFDSTLIDTDAQTDVEKGDIEKAIDTGLDLVPGVGGGIKTAKDWLIH
tara:strand:- start:223 stop:1650 length:1428 start_codon:yes stop_codon:yes gene_type:complete